MGDAHENYKQLVSDASKFNNNLFSERRLRSPFIDGQTGIAQTDCTLWRNPIERRDATASKNTAIVYSYPAARWHMRRRGYLMHYDSVLPKPIATSSCNIDQHLDAYASNSASSSPRHNRPSDKCQVDAIYTDSSSYASSSQQTQLIHSRADSTGSHSCTTADSDSRDLSIATSQSFDSPKHLSNDGHTANGQSAHEAQQSTGSNQHYIELSSIVMSTHGDLKQQRADSIDQRPLVSLEASTKAAIKLHSKMSKKKNVGQSLIQPMNNNSTSILLKSTHQSNDRINREQHQISESKLNGHETGNNQTPELHTKPSGPKIEAPAIISNGSRPFMCSMCDHSYKTRPGLSYHFLHAHNATISKTLPNSKPKTAKQSNSDQTSDNNNNSKSKQNHKQSSKRSTAKKSKVKDLSILVKSSTGNNNNTSPRQLRRNSNLACTNGQNSCFQNGDNQANGHASKQHTSDSETETEIEEDNADDREQEVQKEETLCDKTVATHKKSKSNPFCDFCLGTANRNRRTKLAEELISCTKCGSSGHPSCLRFSENIILSVRKYDWQCIECKTCSNCDNADNEDQLLFCDDCDRSYHTYCLKPPLTTLPEGNWSCHLCQMEYHPQLDVIVAAVSQ